MARGDGPPTHRQVQDSAHVQGQETPELGSHRGGVNSILLTTEKTPAPCVRPTSSPGLSLNLGKYWFKEEKQGPHCVGAAGESFPIWLGAPFSLWAGSAILPTCCFLVDSQKVRPQPCCHSRDMTPALRGDVQGTPTELGSFFLLT